MDDIQSFIKQLKKFDPDELIRRGKEFNFEDVEERLKKYFRYINLLEKEKDFLAELPDKEVQEIKTVISRLVATVTQISGFDPTIITDPSTIRDDLASKLINFYQMFYRSLYRPLENYLTAKTVQTTGFARRIEAELDPILKTAKETKSKLDNILQHAREATGKVGVMKFAGVFGQQARIHKIAAGFWGGFVVLATLGMGFFIWYIFSTFINAAVINASITNGTSSGVDIGITIQSLIAKLFIFSFFSITYFYLIRTFMANMHLYTLNKHRENTLITFQTFVDSVEDEKTKQVVLIQATKAIFEAGATGFITSKDSRLPGLDTIKIIEQIKGE